tara:strand:+ start:994 stop:1623 length:630 start_codon:yes stop_codon:yes gene_type:complete
MVIIKNFLLKIFFLIFILSTSIGTSSSAEQNDSPQLNVGSPMILGDTDAPVTIVEYASFTCPHCATFHLEVLPRIKKNYLDKGLVQLEYREVYFDGPGLWAGLLARCKGDDKYFPMIDLLFKKQEDWTKGNLDNIKEGLLSMGRQAGLTNDESLACMQDDNLAEQMVVSFQENAKRDNIKSTPSFLINGELVKNLPYEEFEDLIEKYLD